MFDQDMMRKKDMIEAEGLLRGRIAEIRQRPFGELVRLIETADCVEVKGQSGKDYQIEVNADWDDKEKTRLRVSGSIDDGGFRAWINWGRLIQGFFAFADGRTE